MLSLPLFLGASCGFVPEKKVQDGGIWLSTDKGYNWEQKVYVGPGEDEADEADDEFIDNIGISLLKFHPLDSRIIYAITPKGIYFTENSGDNWQIIYPEPGVNNIVADPHQRGTIYIAKGNAVLKTEDNGQNWKQVYIESRPGVSITDIAIDQLESTRIYIGTNQANLIISLDAGASWQMVEGFVSAVAESGIGQFNITKILINPRDRKQIYVTSQLNGIWVTFDQGVTWENLKENYIKYPGATDFRSLLIDETRDGALLYASAYGLLWSYNGGFDWNPVELLTPPATVNIKALALNPNNPEEIYYANETVLYKSFNGGIEWIAENLPSKRAAGSLIVDFFDGNRLYLGFETPPKKKSGLIGL